MNKRLRKKLHLKEFAALGFQVQGTFASTSTSASRDTLFDDFIES